MGNKQKLPKRGFTLVEMIVTIGIIIVLAVIVSLVVIKWLSKSRDTGRLSNINVIQNSLQIYLNDNGKLPIPEKNVIVYKTSTDSSDNIIGYQGYFTEKTTSLLGRDNDEKTPKDGDDYFTYYANGDLDEFQIMGYLENPLSYNSNIANAKDYSSKYVYVKGNELGVFVDANKIPIQELGYTGLDLANLNEGYTAYLNNTQTIVGTGKTLLSLFYRKELTTLNDGLILHFSFEQESGNIVEDLSDNGNAGIISGDINYTGGISGRGLYFDGKSCIVFYKAFFNDKSEYSFSLWIYGWTGNLGGIFSEGQPATTYKLYLSNYSILSSSWNLYYNPYTYRYGNYLGSGNVNYNGWNLITVVAKNLDTGPSGMLDYYMNGEKVSTNLSQKEYNPISLSKLYSAIGAAAGGLWNGGQTPVYYIGAMDEIRFYNRALSEDEVKALYFRPGN